VAGDDKAAPPPPGHSPGAALASPSTGQTIAAFCVGCAVLLILAAGAFFGLLPDAYHGPIIRLLIAVAGAGFASFLLGFFEWTSSTGIKTGGTLGVFVLLMFLPTEDVIQSRTLEACKNNLLGNETLIVEEKCKAAVDENPKDDRAWYWYAHSQYRQGQFESAIAAWEKAASLGASKSNSYYNIALAEKQRGRLAEAIEAGTIAVEAANHKEPVARALAYDLLADAHAALWDEGKGPATHFKQAEKDYLLFLEIGRPKYRARADLACLYAIKGGGADPAERQALYKKSAKLLGDAVNELKDLNWPGADGERADFVKQYRSGSRDACAAALAAAWTEQGPGTAYGETIESLDD
jgi:tetratricopeptide (TPR) repeat protein